MSDEQEPGPAEAMVEGMRSAMERVVDDIRAMYPKVVEALGGAIEPIDLTGPPKALVFVQPGWGDRLKELAPHDPASKPFLAGPLTVSGEFSGTFYPGAIERLTEAMRKHPDYCSACDGFPCRGGHPPAG